MAARFSSVPVSLNASRSGLHAAAELLGHLAAWVGLYVGGCVVVAGLLLHGDVSGLALSIAMPTAVGTYLIDRVRPLPGPIDPADTFAHARRAAVLARFGTPVRMAALLLVALAAVLAIVLAPPVAVVAVLGAPVGVLLYSHRRGASRPKDRLLVKNAFVAVSITALVLVLEGHGVGLFATVAVGIFLVLHVFSDAMLCDIDDRHADAQFGTRTIPNTLGVSATWTLAIVMECVALATILLAASWQVLAWDPALLVGLAALGATLVLRSLHATRIKDLVDLKLPIAVVVAWAMLSLSGAIAA